MSTFSGLEVRQVPLYISRRRTEWETLLRSHGLSPSEPIAVAGLYDSADILRGCASLCRCGSRLSVQCVAMDDALDEHGQVGRLIDFLRPVADSLASDGSPADILLFTKPEYENRFRSLAFHTVGRAPRAVMLESNPRGISSYVSALKAVAAEGRNGVIVMNANPCTLGHQYLIREAACQVDNLYVIPVGDDTPGGFPYVLRRHMLRQATAGLSNVRVVEGSPYAISAATFPSYFIKEITDRTDTHILLDLDIFRRHIAPALGAAVRFVGTEPSDPLTARYNEIMARELPRYGIEVHVTERIAGSGGSPVSATAVRRMLAGRDWKGAAGMLPRTTTAALLADSVVGALSDELAADPKPGLVTPSSRGAHTDMDYRIMRRGIDALRSFFEQMAMLALRGPVTHESLVALGMAAEHAMLEATGGINTHKGAIFSLGIMTVAAARAIDSSSVPLDASSLQESIVNVAAPFGPPAGTHGAEVRSRNTALRSVVEMAREGYPELFDEWLPLWRSLPENDPMRRQKLLLTIMSRLDDTNICHRGGDGVLDSVKAEAAGLLDNFSAGNLDNFCSAMTRRNLSPGGAADMLALTLLADRLITK